MLAVPRLLFLFHKRNVPVPPPVSRSQARFRSDTSFFIATDRNRRRALSRLVRQSERFVLRETIDFRGALAKKKKRAEIVR